MMKDSMKLELYHLEEDIQELKNIADLHPEIKQMEEIIELEYILTTSDRFKIKVLRD